jgi:hypothetical protein
MLRRFVVIISREICNVWKQSLGMAIQFLTFSNGRLPLPVAGHELC